MLAVVVRREAAGVFKPNQGKYIVAHMEALELLNSQRGCECSSAVILRETKLMMVMVEEEFPYVNAGVSHS